MTCGCGGVPRSEAVFQNTRVRVHAPCDRSQDETVDIGEGARRRLPDKRRLTSPGTGVREWIECRGVKERIGYRGWNLQLLVGVVRSREGEEGVVVTWLHRSGRFEAYSNTGVTFITSLCSMLNSHFRAQSRAFIMETISGKLQHSISFYWIKRHAHPTVFE